MKSEEERLGLDELDAMDARASAARKSPWRSNVERRDDNVGGGNFIMIGPQGDRGVDLELIGATTADQDFIAAARQDIPRLLIEVRALRKRIAEIESE